MSDDERGKELYDQDPDLDEDFRDKEWPFSGKGALDDVPVPTGEACSKISRILGGASEHSGDFSFGGQANLLPPIPGLFVDGCEKSPFGHDMATKMDEKVRKSWQLAPEQVQLKNLQWTAGIDKMAVTVADQLGYKDIPLQCVLYKLLVGAATEFARRGRSRRLSRWRGEAPPRFWQGAGTATYLTHYAVHYADTEHAVENVTKGYRLVLVYSVCLPPTMRHLERNPNKPMSEAVAEAIETIEPENNPFALLLSHEYTKKSIKGFGSSALKGVDRARFLALEEANASVSAEKKLQFYIVELFHEVHFYGNNGDIGDWEEERGRRAEKTTWYTTDGESFGDCNTGVKFNFLNPVQETLSQMWKKPYGRAACMATWATRDQRKTRRTAGTPLSPGRRWTTANIGRGSFSSGDDARGKLVSTSVQIG
ncbi:hypothetical protein PHYPSEUDO_004680 [Phytophthora pseudosyringae]|uniref:Uncharacterized protein n=1 Tax=Phytophthora pseudosyringae TaxID=221518 RepID=A0A8T1VR55_9STRA|nr:hypothetical protein PHYPSEUDO_004680 [Phytophthora pseudosyringae]